jgi:urease accessory protein
MGATPARITAEDFVTPPELARWSLASGSAGRIGGVRLELESDSEETRLGQCYQQVPLRVLPPFRFGAGQPSLLYLLNPTAGLMDGDGQLVEVRAGSGTRAVVAGQSATRIHPAVHGFSTQQWHVQVERDAVLVVLPGPAIPFRSSRYLQRVRIDLEPGASLIWGDLWFAGRYARKAASEQFQFEIIVQDFTVYREGRLVFRDRFVWRGPWDEKQAAWHFASQPACGSLFATGSLLDSALIAQNNCQPAIFRTGAGDTCVRWLGSSEEAVGALVTSALRIAGSWCGGGPWLLPFRDLGPNHWFLPAYCPRDTVPNLEQAMGMPSGSGRPATSNSRS